MSPSPTRVLVAGATGVVGLPAVRALVAGGHEVTGVARSAAKADRLRAEGAHPVAVDLFDPVAVKDAAAGHDVVVNLATHVPPTSKAWRAGAWAENERLRTEASTILADAALAVGATRFVQEALAFAYADHGDAWIDEDEPLDPPEGLDGVRTAEANARRVTDAGGTGVVLRFGNFYGPTAAHTRDQWRLARRRISSTLGPLDAPWSVIHTDDAGTAVAAALSAPPGPYHVVDDEPLRRRELDLAIAHAA
ncbi:MAG: NAD(P)H-binding protein, partial [Acidimicrobiales bacterium]|nr:NAD(P)H-binding protein [Acidimicrobiales bacterium]